MSFNAKGFDPKITSKGTELPLMNLKGKPYLQVAHRLVWFREDHPHAEIRTSVLALENDQAVFRADISIEGKLIASAHKRETKADFGDFIEKAETGAIGRALAMAGYGTQFEPELDEGNRLADAPIAVAKTKEKANEPTEPSNEGRKSTIRAEAVREPEEPKQPSSPAPAAPAPKRNEEAIVKAISTTALALTHKHKDMTREKILALINDRYKIKERSVTEATQKLSKGQREDLLAHLEGVLNG